ncbi:tRNA 2-thiocytidine biosynthesis TtcA family protein [Senegalia massiliensis]|uniref:tRNA 2-thiocytidine biosynthesis protein TtcA n=1 Tax=Senegalia massiliensis TaxID=1720316 RepID=A0A845QWK8_9CLOT|nr:ATP-binding protein [Senegalia massiliensis]NBI06374.1 tRNA 2-thiocytidine biosynthesis protein TtcA [Senegalia massiliensis]
MDKLAGKGCKQLIPDEDKIPLKDIERNIIKRYRKYLWSPFVKAISNYNLVEEGDKVAVAISGGKDSLLLAKLFQELKKHGNINFEIEFLAMDPGYHEDIKKLLIENCNYLDIPVKIFESKIFEIADEKASEYPCYLCARMRRGALYRKSKELGCNKLALGHHFNDVIETTMLNVLYSGNFKTMLPKLKSQNYEGIELIRPMYYIREDDIERFTETSGIWPLNCACMVAAKKIGNKRYEIKELISQMKENFVDVDKSIFKAAENVNIDRILGYKKDDKKYSFLDFYDE